MSRAREADGKRVGSRRRTITPRGPSRTRITRLAKQSAKRATVERIDFRAQWNAELRAHLHGQQPMLSSTWLFDNLYEAANWQARAEDAEDLLAWALDNNTGETNLPALATSAEYAWGRARDAFPAGVSGQGVPRA